MYTEIHNNIELSLFDMYGVLDIRGYKNRCAQIELVDGRWNAKFFWYDEQNQICIHDPEEYTNKESAKLAGMNWVTNKTRRC